ncbi:MAG: lipopolysaccharide transport periplasmic protein LptA [Desulfobacteraceae bacterium]|nr:lipopolysaccharide transport periplasmic protein LptA [Desulfobacteraceae bacterium]
MKKHLNKFAFALITFAAITLCNQAYVCVAAQTQDADLNKNKQPIQVTADRLVIDNKARTAEFSKNVKATQGTTKISAERMVIYYNGKASEQNATKEDSIEKIIAKGKVRIETDNGVADTKEAVYTAEDGKLILSGKGSKLVQGKNVITGSKITIDRNTGHVEAEGDGSNQVKAIMQPKQRDLN